MKKYLLGIAALAVFSAAPAFAAQEACAIINGTVTGGPDGEGVNSTYASNVAANPTGANIGCNVLITFNSNGSITTTNPNNAISYDGGNDDNLVGIVNNSGHAITSINLSNPGVDIFGFDGDGACDTDGGHYTFSASGAGGTTACAGAVASTNGWFYLPAGVTDSGVNGAQTAGTIDFAGSGIANGGTAWFSLEGPVSLSLQVNATPEPGTLVLFGSGLIGLAGVLRRKLSK